MLKISPKLLWCTFFLRNSQPKFYPKNGSFWFVSINQELRWFKLSGKNEQNLNFHTRFSQIRLRLDKKWWWQMLLKISPELIWCHFFSEIFDKNFTPIMGHFSFFQLIKNYELIDLKIISQEAFYAAQQNLKRSKFSKICANSLKIIF